LSIYSGSEFGRIFLPATRAKKPGFPLQVLGFANANPVGFPLQSLARAQRQRKIASRFCRQPGRMGFHGFGSGFL
jgi:hypothetical protein